MWASGDNGVAICTEWDWQACDDVKGGPFTCHCDKPYKLVVCQNSDKGNVGRLFLTCRQDPPCKFFQWADQERPRKAIRAHREVTGNTYSRENRLRRETDIYREPQTKRQKLITDAYARPVPPYRPSYGGGGGKRIEPKVQQLRDTHFERAEEESKARKNSSRKKSDKLTEQGMPTVAIDVQVLYPCGTGCHIDTHRTELFFFLFSTQTTDDAGRMS